MKLIIAIVQDEDSGRLLTGLTEKGFGVTRLATTGGFLKAGNTTMMIGVEDEQVDEAVQAVDSFCRSRKRMTATQTGDILHGGGISPIPIEVNVGGATLFVLSVDRFMKV